jgi:hypothetical protein
MPLYNSNVKNSPCFQRTRARRKLTLENIHSDEIIAFEEPVQIKKCLLLKYLYKHKIRSFLSYRDTPIKGSESPTMKDSHP